jgi:predicted Zn-dependent protease
MSGSVGKLSPGKTGVGLVFMIGKLIATALLILALMGGSVAQSSSSSQSDPNDDPILRAMLTEMERSKTKLKLEGMQLPYYVDYRVMELDDFNAEAIFGAVRNQARQHFRVLRVVVRVGDYKQDSYYGPGEGTLELAPLDDDELGLRHQLWLATDRAYKAAMEALTAKQAQLKQFSVDQPVDDFAHAPVLQSIGERARLNFDPQPWLKMLKEASALYRGDPQIESLSTSVRFQAVNRYFVNSEGTVVRSGQGVYVTFVAGFTQASDGMRLDRSHGDAVTDARELPGKEKFLSQTRDLLGTLKALRDARVIEEDYRGPVLLSADAAATVVATLVGPNVLGKPGPLGQNVRTTGAWANSYKSRVLPDFLSVVDDPTISKYEGDSLLGKYQIDDEGVKATRVPVVEKGQLVNYLMGRQPIRDFPTSNGHGRGPAVGAPTASVGNLIVQSSEPLSDEELKKKLVEICKQRELPYGYLVETLGPRMVPRLLYQVWAKDGHQELVRGAIFGDLDTRSLRNNVIAAGKKLEVEDRTEPVPHSILSPALLFDELELKRADASKEKLPDYPAPATH